MAQYFAESHDRTVGHILCSGPEHASNKPDKNGMTCVNRAVAYGDLILLDRLLAAGCNDLNIGDNDGNTPLIYAVSLGHHLVVMRLLRCTNIAVDKRNNCGVTALMKAAIHNHNACVDLLLKAGASTELTDYTRGLTALQWAKHCGSQQSVKMLTKHVKRFAKNKAYQYRYARSTSDLTFDSSADVRHRKSSPLIDKIKQSLGLPAKQSGSASSQQMSRSSECLSALSGMVARSTSAIPMLIGVSQEDNNRTEEFNLTMLSTFAKKKAILKPPIILITKETGEVVEANNLKGKPCSRRKPSSKHTNNKNNSKVLPTSVHSVLRSK